MPLDRWGLTLAIFHPTNPGNSAAAVYSAAITKNLKARIHPGKKSGALSSPTG
jgi:hypothetical protein